jgi:hypothetical protein
MKFATRVSRQQRGIKAWCKQLMAHVSPARRPPHVQRWPKTKGIKTSEWCVKSAPRVGCSCSRPPTCTCVIRASAGWTADRATRLSSLGHHEGVGGDVQREKESTNHPVMPPPLREEKINDCSTCNPLRLPLPLETTILSTWCVPTRARKLRPHEKFRKNSPVQKRDARKKWHRARTQSARHV